LADYDVVVVGGGHNGLIAAAYLAREGLRVAVIERKTVLGGAAATTELWPGHHADVGAASHVVFKQTGIAEDLGLAEHGLQYLDFDPMYVALEPGGPGIHFWRDLDRTCESIAAVSPEDAEAYRRFVQTWAPVAPFFLDLFTASPSVTGAAGHFWAQLRRGGPGVVELLAGLASSPAALVRKHFRHPLVQATLAFASAQTGLPTGTAGAGGALVWWAMSHAWGHPAPRGGSGALAEALHRKLVSLGGRVFPGQPARSVKRAADGVVVETDDGPVGAHAVVMATHLRTTLRLLGDTIPARASGRLGAVPLGNGAGVKLHLVTDRLPAFPGIPDGGAAAHRGIQQICPSLEHLERGYADFLAGRPAREPALAMTSPSAFDPTRAPSGRHVLGVWAQWYPYALADGQRWDDIREAQTERILDTIESCSPGFRGTIRELRFDSPLDLERDLDLPHANIMHLPMTPDRLMTSRPARGYASYRLAPGVYVTGASTHPGGGVIGASGRLAAAAVLHDLTGSPS
jgi:phytoene dehydrogenase-like protein